jgi:hypothetical protein
MEHVKTSPEAQNNDARTLNFRLQSCPGATITSCLREIHHCIQFSLDAPHVTTMKGGIWYASIIYNVQSGKSARATRRIHGRRGYVHAAPLEGM